MTLGRGTMRTGSPEGAREPTGLPSPLSSCQVDSCPAHQGPRHQAQHIQTATAASILKETPPPHVLLLPGPNAPALH